MVLDDEQALLAEEYGEFRKNFTGIYSMPEWELLEVWMREALLAAYVRGKIDGLRME